MRKSSTRVTLALIGVAALAGCGGEQRRDVYKSREDCLADWNTKPEDCKPATDAQHASRGYWYGPIYPIPFGYSSSAFQGRARSIGSSSSGTHSGSVSRGGFGSSARSSGG